LVEGMKQNNNSRKPVSVEISILWALQNGFFDDIDVKKIGEAQASFEDFITTSATSLLEKIVSEKVISNELSDMLKEACSNWKKTFA